MLTAVHQALLHKQLTPPAKERPRVSPLSLHISIRLERTTRTSQGVYPPIHPYDTNAQGRRKASRINKLDRSGNFSIRCSWKPIVGRIRGRSTSTFLRVRLEVRGEKLEKGRMEGGCWLVGGWVEERATLCLRRRDSFLLPSLSPFRRKTFGCLPRDNFLRYVINVYGQPASQGF